MEDAMLCLAAGSGLVEAQSPPAPATPPAGTIRDELGERLTSPAPSQP